MNDLNLLDIECTVLSYTLSALIQDANYQNMPNLPRKNSPTLTITIYHLKPWTWVLTQFWTFEIISINKKVTACQTEVVFSFFDISSKLPGRILGTLRGPNKKKFFLLICMAMTYNILNFEPNRWPWLPKSVTLGMKPPFNGRVGGRKYCMYLYYAV